MSDSSRNKEYHRRWRKLHKKQVILQKRAWRKSNPEAVMIERAKRRAKKKGLTFSIRRTDIHIPTHCPLLGIPLGKGGTDNSPSLDRIDPTKGYVKGNVWVVSQRANRIKNDASLDELKRMVRALGRALK